ncbi:MAG: hypothetical protein ABEI86_11855 [Halobacteriaceae archaeon]
MDMNYPLFGELNVDQTSVKITLQKAGVANTLADLSWDSFYRALSKLPEVDPEGTYAQRLYSLVLSKDGSPSGEEYNNFLKKGEMLGEKGGEISYFPIDELRFPESEALPRDVIKKYPILQVQTQESATKIADRFGVQPLSMDDLHITSIDFEPHRLSDAFENEFQQLKQFIYALRLDTTRESQARRAIEDLDVQLCDSFEAEAEVKSDVIPIELDHRAPRPATPGAGRRCRRIAWGNILYDIRSGCPARSVYLGYSPKP